MKLLNIIIICGFAFFTSGCQFLNPNSEIKGSVFIVTKEASVYKLAGVHILICKTDNLLNKCKSISNDYTSQNKSLLNQADTLEKQIKLLEAECINEGYIYYKDRDSIDNILSNEALKIPWDAAKGIYNETLSESETSSDDNQKYVYPLYYWFAKNKASQVDSLVISIGDSTFDNTNKALENLSSFADIKKVYDLIEGPSQEHKAKLEQSLNSLKDRQVELANISSKLDELKQTKAQELFALSDAHTYDTQTDADGNFDLSVPRKNSYIIFCKASRLVSTDNQENYMWAVPITFNGTALKVVQLNNNNELLSGKSDIITIANSRPNNEVLDVITLIRNFVSLR